MTTTPTHAAQALELKIAALHREMEHLRCVLALHMVADDMSGDGGVTVERRGDLPGGDLWCVLSTRIGGQPFATGATRIEALCRAIISLEQLAWEAP